MNSLPNNNNKKMINR